MDVLGCSYGAMVDSGWKCTTPWQHGCEMEEMAEIREKLVGEGRQVKKDVDTRTTWGYWGFYIPEIS